MQYNDSYNENVLSFANSIHTRDGGTHVTGFRKGLTRTINDYGKRKGNGSRPTAKETEVAKSAAETTADSKPKKPSEKKTDAKVA